MKLTVQFVRVIAMAAIILNAGGCSENQGSQPVTTGPASPPLWGFVVEGLPDSDRLCELACQTTISPDMVVFFLQWPEPDRQQQAGFPENTLAAIWRQGAMPVLTWEPFYHLPDGSEHMISVRDICDGHYDAYIQKFAEAAATYGHPFLIRFAHEMNLSRYHWGGPADAYSPDSPAAYTRLFQYVVNKVKAHGAGNVLWVFCPNAESVPDTSADAETHWNRIASYYPGPDYVDVVGMDGYNWGTSRTQSVHGWVSRWQSFQVIFQAAYHELRAIAPEKPLFVFETGSVTAGGDRAQWVADMFDTLGTWKVHGVCWFQAEKENPWHLTLPADKVAIQAIRRRKSVAYRWLETQGGIDEKR
ncbi:MAG: glycosyl hydrolase [Thermodesulfobacteriota bacterium]|nr:glycosyl hydrolase [Thermodesulfobacteriota bacterium]